MEVRWLLGITAFLTCYVEVTKGHGRLIEPPSRATMWRYGFDTPPNYNDHELYCGGYSRQWQRNGGKCGICGDAYDLPKPRPHEAGGRYGNGIIVRKYRKDFAITIRIELTANHKGYFEFRLCPNNAPHKVATQECLDLYLLKIAKNNNGGYFGDKPAIAHEYRYYPSNGTKVFETRYQLPKDLTCAQCVLQWRYIAGNNWGMCPNGTGQVGCGPQEEFRACADVSIVDGSGAADETPFDNEYDTDEESGKPEEGISGTDVEPEWWYLLVVIVFATLFFVLATFAMLYFYFYKRETFKNWWEEKHISIISRDAQEKQFHFWKTFKEDNKKLRFWNKWGGNENMEKEKNYAIPQPIPPARKKRINRV